MRWAPILTREHSSCLTIQGATAGLDFEHHSAEQAAAFRQYTMYKPILASDWRPLTKYSAQSETRLRSLPRARLTQHQTAQRYPLPVPSPASQSLPAKSCIGYLNLRG